MSTSAPAGSAARAVDAVTAFASSKPRGRFAQSVLICDGRGSRPVVHSFSRAQWLAEVGEKFPADVRDQVWASALLPGFVPFVIVTADEIQAGELKPSSVGVA